MTDEQRIDQFEAILQRLAHEHEPREVPYPEWGRHLLIPRPSEPEPKPTPDKS